MSNNYWHPNSGMRFPNEASSDVPGISSNYQAWMSQYGNERPIYAETVILTANKGTGIDLGDGFESFNWSNVYIGNEGIKKNLFVHLKAPDMKVISAGWSTSSGNTLVRIDSHFPYKKDTWVINVINETKKEWDPNPQPLLFYLIAKS